MMLKEEERGKGEEGGRLGNVVREEREISHASERSHVSEWRYANSSRGGLGSLRAHSTNSGTVSA